MTEDEKNEAVGRVFGHQGECNCIARSNAIDPTPRAAARPGPHHEHECPRFQRTIGDVPPDCGVVLHASSRGSPKWADDPKNSEVARLLGHMTPLETLAHDQDDSIGFWAAMGADSRTQGAKLDDARGWGLDVADFADESDPEAAYTMALAAWRAGWKIADTIARMENAAWDAMDAAIAKEREGLDR